MASEVSLTIDLTLPEPPRKRRRLHANEVDNFSNHDSTIVLPSSDSGNRLDSNALSSVDSHTVVDLTEEVSDAETSAESCDNTDIFMRLLRLPLRPLSPVLQSLRSNEVEDEPDVLDLTIASPRVANISSLYDDLDNLVLPDLGMKSTTCTEDVRSLDTIIVEREQAEKAKAKRLRQIEEWVDDDDNEYLMKKLRKMVLVCPICQESLVDRSPMSTPCGHLFCGSCIQTALNHSPKCPMCQHATTLFHTHKVYL